MVNNKAQTLIGFMINVLEIIAIVGSVFLVNIYSLAGRYQFPEVTLFSGEGWTWMRPCAFVTLIIVFLIKKNGIWADFLAAWRKNWLLAVFVAVALSSLLWTVYFPASLYKLVFLIFATLVGSYISIRYKLEGVVKVLTWIAGLSVIFSWVVVLFFPIGTMYNEPYTGSWRGMFWHRNHMGNLTAFFNMIFLFRLLSDSVSKFHWKIIYAVFYVLSGVLVFGSRSATGVILFFILNFATLLAWAWLKWHKRLQRWHYHAAAALMALGVLVFMINLEFFFGLLGRSANMTGRVPLWQDLFLNVWLKMPILGSGYGALWMQESFRELMADRLGWRLFPVFFADNGFLDILLNLGLIGFIPFGAMFVASGVRVFRSGIASRSWMGLFPVLSILYIIIGNLTYSFLLEVDQFVWMLLVIMMFVAPLTGWRNGSVDPS